MVKNLLSNAGDVGLIPGLRTEIPYAIRQLNPRNTTREVCAPQQRSNSVKKENYKGEKIHLQTVLYLLIPLVYVARLQDVIPTSILSYMIQNIVDVTQLITLTSEMKR